MSKTKSTQSSPPIINYNLLRQEIQQHFIHCNNKTWDTQFLRQWMLQKWYQQYNSINRVTRISKHKLPRSLKYNKSLNKIIWSSILLPLNKTHITTITLVCVLQPSHLMNIQGKQALLQVTAWNYFSYVKTILAIWKTIYL